MTDANNTRRGKTIEFAGGALTLHPLTLLQVQQLSDDIAATRRVTRESSVSSKEANERLGRLLVAGAHKAHPEITAASLLAMIDMEDVANGTVSKAMRKLMGVPDQLPQADGTSAVGPEAPPATRNASPVRPPQGTDGCDGLAGPTATIGWE
jgi:hypothetical protein